MKSKNYTIIVGYEQITSYINSQSKYINPQQALSPILQKNVEPISYEFLGDVSSEKFTSFNGKPFDNYIPVDNHQSIFTPEENYKPDKLSPGLTIEHITQQRNSEAGIV